MTERIKMFGRRLILAALPLSLVLSVAVATPAAHPSQAAAATSCIRIINGNFNAKGPDDFMPYLNGEYIVIHSYCATAVNLGGWHVTDLAEYKFTHSFTFPAGYTIGAFKTIYLRSGTGTNTTVNVYWQRVECQVWNNAAPERAFLRWPNWTIVGSWSPFP